MRLVLFFVIVNASFLSSLYAQEYQENLERDVLTFTDIASNEELDKPQIFSASRSNKVINDLPFTVTVIEREEILKNGYVTLVDVLKSMPGIKVSQPGSGEEGETFLFRGFIGNTYTKILINGIPIQPSVLGGIPIGAQLPIRQAERIEIIYGSSSALYGADATAGVINIITKKPDKGFFAQGDIETGSDGYKYLNFMLGGKTGKDDNTITYSIYGSSFKRDRLDIYKGHEDIYNPMYYVLLNDTDIYFDWDGYGFTPENPLDFSEEYLDERFKEANVPEDIQKEIKEDYFVDNLLNYRDKLQTISQQSSMLGAEIAYKGFKLSLNSMYRRDYPSLGRSNYLYTYEFPQIYFAETIQRLTLSYNKNLSDNLSTTTNFSYLRHRQDKNTAFSATYNDGNFSYIYQASDDFFGEHLVSYNFHKNFELVTGISFQYSSNLPKTNELFEPFDPQNYKPFKGYVPEPDPILGDFGYNPVNFKNIAGFIQLYATYQKFNLIAGFRADNSSLYGATFNPRAAAIYKFTSSTSIEASFGTAFKAPASSVIYYSLGLTYDIPDSLAIYAVTPNTDLEPEIFQSFESSVKHNFSENLNLSVSVFYNRITNLIKGVVIPIDTLKYPNASPFDSDTRTNINSNEAKASLAGLQVSLRGRNLIKPINAGFDLNITLSEGTERLAENQGNLNDFRMMPEFMAQLKLNFTLFEKLYLNFENVCMGGWYRRYTPSYEAFNNPLFKNDGYYTLDILADYKVSENVSAFFRMKNVFDAKYGGIGATGLDVDLLYNPQLARNTQVGLRFNLN
ncbi:MAG: hypothetical protein CMO01_28910 [Thalassobius sp.]|nr:hypothetical protein [Thalassovita sp.]